MRFKKSVQTLVVLIIVLSAISALVGIFSTGGPGKEEFDTVNEGVITLYGKGLYQNESESGAAQVIAQDIVTLILGIPLLLAALFMIQKNSLRGRLILTGTLGYFLYTYASYSFLCNYNRFFLVYVLLMGLSFYAFVLSMMSFDMKNLHKHFSKELPVGFLSGFILFIGIVVGLMWLGRIFPPLLKGEVPEILEHYTTLIIQALDLGFVVPTAILAGILLIKRNSFGYLLGSVMIVKSFTMLTAMSAMVIGQLRTGVSLSMVEVLIFPIFNLIAIYCLVLILKHVKEPNVLGGN